VIRIVLRTLLALLASAVVLALVGLLALRVGAGTRAVNRVLSTVKLPPGLTISAGNVKSNGFTWVEARDLRLSHGQGRLTLSVDRLRGRYDVLSLLSGRIVVHDLQLTRPRLVIQRRSDHSPELPKVPLRKTNSPDSKPPVISIRGINVIAGAFLLRFGDSAADSIAAGFEAQGSLDGSLVHLSRLRVRSNGSSLAGSGTVPLSSKSEFDLALVAEPLSWSDLRFLGSRFDRGGGARLSIHTTGTTRRLGLDIDAVLSDGGAVQARGIVTPSRDSSLEYRAQAELRRVDAAWFLAAGGLPRRIDGEAMLELAGPSRNRLSGEARVSVRASPSNPTDHRRAVARALFDGGRARIEVQGDVGLAALAIRGWVRPFDSIPSYDVKGRARYLSRPSPSFIRLLGKDSRHLTLSIAGRGFNPRQANLQALAAIDSRPGNAGLLDSGAAKIRLRNGVAGIRSVVGLTGGTVTAAGTATLGPELELRVDRASLKGVDIAAVLGDSNPSSLDAELTFHSRGTSPTLARFQATIHAVDLSYGPHDVHQGRLDLSLQRGAARVTGKAQVDGGSLEAIVTAHPFGAEPGVRLRELRFSHIDLARLIPGSGITGEVSGTVRGGAHRGRREDPEASAVLTLEPSQIGTQPITHARVETRLAHRRIEVMAEAAAPAGHLRLSGFGLPFDTVPRYALQNVAFQRVDLGQLLSKEGLRTDLTGSLRVEALGRNPEAGSATGRLTLEASTINDAVINTGQVDAKLDEGELSLSGIVRTEGDSLTLSATAYPFESRPRARLTSELALKPIALLLSRGSLGGAGTVGIRLEGEWGSPETLSLNGQVVGRGSIAELHLDSLNTSFRLMNGTLTVDTLALGSNVGTMAGSGTVALFGRANRSRGFRLSGRFRDLAPLTPLLGVSRLSLDSGGFTATVQGQRDSLRVALAAYGGDLAVDARRVGEFQATFSGELAADRFLSNGTADVRLERLVLGGTRLRKIGLQGNKQGSEVLLRIESVVDQERSARVVARLTPDRSRLELDTLEVVVPKARWALAHPVGVGYGDRIEVEDFLLASGGRRIAINGVVDRRGEQQLTATIDSLELGPFVELLGAPEIDGELNGSLKLTGQAAEPRAQGAVHVVLRSGKKRVLGARGRVDWSSAGLRLDAGLDQSDGDSLTLRGRIPLALSLRAGDTSGVVSRVRGGTLALDAVTDRFRIQALAPLVDPETIKDLEGSLRMNAHATGTLEAPQLAGDITVADAKLHIPRLGATYEKGQIRLGLQGREVRLTQVHLESGGGRLETTGTVRLQTFPKAAFDLQTKLSKFRVADADDIRTSLSGTVNLAGTTDAPVLTGSLQVRSTDVYLQAKNLQQSAEAVELTPEDQRTLERRFGYGEASRSQKPRRPLAPWSIDLSVQLKENNWLRRRSDPVMVVELGGKLNIRKSPGEDLTFFGEIQPLPGRSFVQMLGRRFDLKQGSVRLNGPLNQTAVAVDAEYRASTPSGVPPVLITTAIRADTGSLSVTLSSIPAMRSEDIMSYLTTGRAADASPAMESDEQDVLTTTASLAVGVALGTVAGQAGQKVGLDVIQVLQDRDGGQTLVAGKYVSPPLYLGVRTPIVAPANPGRSETQRDVAEFEVEYATLRQLLLNLQGAGSELRFFLRLRR
jgi:translocation and assembly module TamB